MIMKWSFPADPYNKEHKRNVRNTNKQAYNCAGYAFGTFSAMNLSHTWDNDRRMMHAANMGDYAEALQIAVEDIGIEFPDWRAVENLDDYSVADYDIVALRFSRFDFHVWKLGRNNSWYNKWGRTDIIERRPYNDVFAPYWMVGRFTAPYDSPIVFFVRPR